MANIVKGILKASAGNPKESFSEIQAKEPGGLMFMHGAKHTTVHRRYQLRGGVIFNVGRCRSTQMPDHKVPQSESDRTVEDEQAEQAAELGIDFCWQGRTLRAGSGLEVLQDRKRFFPVFTNGTMIDADLSCSVKQELDYLY